jgi:polysaccharide biosynthesis protein PslH
MDKPALVILLSRFPYPLEKGDKLRAYHQIKELSRHFNIHLYCLSFHKVNKEHQEALMPYVQLIRVFQLNKFIALINAFKYFVLNKPIQNGLLFNSVHYKTMQQEWQIINPAIVYCQLQRIADYVKSTSYKKVLDFQDAFSLNYLRSATQANFPLSIFYKMEAKRVAKHEQQLVKVFDATTIISVQDKQAINANIQVVANGVDINFFTKDKKLIPQYDLLFVGNLGYLPNEQAVRYINTQILPLITKQIPDIKILIAGASPTDYVKSVANENITIQEWLPDIRDAYNNGKIFIAPLFSGAGMQNKVLEAMSMGLPCIVTPIVSKGLGTSHQQELLVATDAASFCKEILHLLAYKKNREDLIAKATSFVQSKFSWQENTRNLVSLLQKLL